jgi:amidophosphoribosyltransferase
MDGITGIYSHNQNELIEKIFLATGAIQHRGKSAAGIAIGNGKGIHIHKGLGRIGDIIDNDILSMFKDLNPIAAIGNIGYTKNKIPQKLNAEPIKIEPKTRSSLEIALTMDGYLVTEDEIKNELWNDYYFNTSNKTEVIGALLHKYIKECGINFDAGKKLIDKLHGKATFAITALVYDGKNTHMISINDDKGFEPFSRGMLNDSFIVSSESVSHRRLGGKIKKEYLGGEMTICTPDNIETKRLRNEKPMQDMFQGVYYGNVASLFREKEIYQLRVDLGKELVKFYGVPKTDRIIPNPESGWGVTMGIFEGVVEELQKKAFDETKRNKGIITVNDISAYDRLIKLKTVYPALVKLAQAVRTFQEGEQRRRTSEVGLKFGSIDNLINDTNIVMGDDSIVKGSVSEGGSIWCVYNSGAKNIEFWISYGPMIFPSFKEWHRGKECMDELAVRKAFKNSSPYGKSLEEINQAVTKKIGVNSVKYNSIDILKKTIGEGSYQALDASYPIDEKFWPDWIKKEVELYNKNS